jgi:hypothetical protein
MEIFGASAIDANIALGRKAGSDKFWDDVKKMPCRSQHGSIYRRPRYVWLVLDDLLGDPGEVGDLLRTSMQAVSEAVRLRDSRFSKDNENGGCPTRKHWCQSVSSLSSKIEPRPANSITGDHRLPAVRHFRHIAAVAEAGFPVSPAISPTNAKHCRSADLSLCCSASVRRSSLRASNSTNSSSVVNVDRSCWESGR